MSQARTWPLSAASSGWLAPRCGRPPLPQPPQEPPPRAATPNVAGGAALVGPGCPPARVSPHLHLAHQLYSGRRTARAAKEASRCGCPPLPQPPQEPLPRVAVPNAAGGAALAGPGCPPARVSLYPPRRLVAGGDPSKSQNALKLSRFGTQNRSKMGQKCVFPKMILDHLGCSNKFF